MNKILKTISFLLLSLSFMTNTNIVYAGGKDYTICTKSYRGDCMKRTVYASHNTLKKLVEEEKKMAENQKLMVDEAMKYLKWIPGLGSVISGMKDITDSIGKGMKAIFGDATFLSSCLEKSANNGERGCVMKYDYITHDETYDEWYPKSCELQ